MQAPVRRWLAAIGLTFVLASCVTNPSPSGAAPGASEPASDQACPSDELLTPAGEPLDLAGRWRANDLGEYFVSQHGSCIYWVGLGPGFEDRKPDTWWTNAFVGHLNSDFTIDGAWGDVPYQVDVADQADGELTLGVGFYDQDGRQWPSMHLVERRAGCCYLRTDWVLDASLPARAVFTGTYQYDGECPWLEVEGQGYELVQTRYYLTSDGHLLDDQNEVIARPGDEVRVEGQVSPQLAAADCQPSAMLAWDLEPVP
jgi:hypothetical protein